MSTDCQLLETLGHRFLVNEAWIGAFVEQQHRQRDYRTHADEWGSVIADVRYFVAKPFFVALHTLAESNLNRLFNWDHWETEFSDEVVDSERLNNRDVARTRQLFARGTDPFGIYKQSRKDSSATREKVLKLREEQRCIGEQLQGLLSRSTDPFLSRLAFVLDPAQPFRSLPHLFAALSTLREVSQPDPELQRKIKALRKRQFERAVANFELEINQTSSTEMLRDYVYELLALAVLRVVAEQDGSISETARLNREIVRLSDPLADRFIDKRVAAKVLSIKHKLELGDLARMDPALKAEGLQRLTKRDREVLSTLRADILRSEGLSEGTRSVAAQALPSEGLGRLLCETLLADPAMTAQATRGRSL